MNPNPFDQDGVIRILLEEADIPILKTLRELNTSWNSLDLKELEKRAIKGQFLDYNFSWGYRGNQKTLDEAKEELGQFLDATRAIPQLFRDFRLHFPESLKLLNSSFFSKYLPIFIYLDINSLIPFNENTTKLLLNFLSWVAPTIKELCIGDTYRSIFNEEVFPTSWWNLEDFLEFFEIPQDSLKFPNLNKFSMNSFAKGLDQFRVILDKGGELNSAPNLNELAIGHLNIDFGDLFGTRSKVSVQRWSTLTRLTLYTDHYSNFDNSEIPRHLFNLSQYGMTLKYLDLKISSESGILSHISETCVILSQFLESQSSSLEYLGLYFSFKINGSLENIPEQEFENYQTSIRLPIFPNVLKLTFNMLNITLDDIRQIPLQMGPFPSHFPKLRSLEIHHADTIRDLFGEMNREPLRIREIIIYDIDFDDPFDINFDWLRANFCNVLKFDYFRTLVNNGLQNLPWADSLEYLRLYCVRAPLKLAHHTRLKYIKVSDSQFGISRSTNVYRKSVHSYLEHFQEILGLNLTKITFKTDKKICDEIKGHIRSYFPFEVEFKSSESYRFF